MTIPANLPSQRVMQKLGLTHDPADDFDHPKLPDWEHRRHVLYRIKRRDWPTADQVRSETMEQRILGRTGRNGLGRRPRHLAARRGLGRGRRVGRRSTSSPRPSTPA